MTIQELSHDEQLALAGLMQALIPADGTVSESEQIEIAEIVEAVGEEGYRALMNEADERFNTIDDLKAFLPSIERQEARQVIYGLSMEDVMAGPGVSHLPSELLDWLKTTWNIHVTDD